MKKQLFLALLGICLATALSACSSGISAMASATPSAKNQSVQSQSTETRIVSTADLLPETGKR